MVLFILYEKSVEITESVQSLGSIFTDKRQKFYSNAIATKKLRFHMTPNESFHPKNTRWTGLIENNENSTEKMSSEWFPGKKCVSKDVVAKNAF